MHDEPDPAAIQEGSCAARKRLTHSEMDELSMAQTAVREPAVQVSRGSSVQHKEKEDVHCAEHEESNPAAIQEGSCAARKRLTHSEMNELGMAQTAARVSAFVVLTSSFVFFSAAIAA